MSQKTYAEITADAMKSASVETRRMMDAYLTIFRGMARSKLEANGVPDWHNMLTVEQMMGAPGNESKTMLIALCAMAALDVANENLKKANERVEDLARELAAKV